MSANNQILIQEHDGNFYLFDNVNAESWSDENELSKNEAIGVYNTEQDAFNKASEIMYSLEYPDECEYGIWINKLAKDGAKIKLI